MTIISVIGSGNMASAIGTLAAKHGHTIEFMSRNTAKARLAAPPQKSRRAGLL